MWRSARTASVRWVRMINNKKSPIRDEYTINELLFKIYLICVILGSLLRNMLGEWEPIYDTYAKELNISDNVKFMGQKANVQTYIVNAQDNVRGHSRTPSALSVCPAGD